MTVNPRKWLFVVLAIAYVLTGLMHLGAFIIMFFAYGGKASISSQPELLPVYGRLGALGFVIFFLTIPLDFVAGFYLLLSRYRGRVLLGTAAVLNLPLIPLGTATGLGTLALLFVLSRGQGPVSEK